MGAGPQPVIRKDLDALPVPPQLDHVALRWLGRRGEIREYTYCEQAVTNRFANALRSLGVGRGDGCGSATGCWVTRPSTTGSRRGRS